MWGDCTRADGVVFSLDSISQAMDDGERAVVIAEQLVQMCAGLAVVVVLLFGLTVFFWWRARRVCGSVGADQSVFLAGADGRWRVRDRRAKACKRGVR